MRPAQAGLAAAVGALIFALPPAVLAHGLTSYYESRLPLAVYLIGAAVAVGLSFAFVILKDVQYVPPKDSRPAKLPPAWLRIALRAIGLLAWLWIVAQGVVGGSSDGDVSTLFLWVYGWVGIPLITAFIFPIWHWIDPFSTLYDIGAWLARTLRISAWKPAPLPSFMIGWPAAVGFVFFVWLELVLEGGPGRTLFVVLLGYTAFTLAMMAQYGRDEWRANAETFTYWFRIVNRLAPFALADEEGRLRRRPFASGLLEPGWTMAGVVVTALAVAAIIYDGLSQTQIWFDYFGAPHAGPETAILLGFLGIVVGLAWYVSRTVGVAATGAGFLPIAVGYLIGHYMTYLLIDGQRIIIALSDPLQRGWDLFGTAFFEPTGDWLPPGIVWTVQLAAVVGGHMLGAWAGHVAAARDFAEQRAQAQAEGAAAADEASDRRALRIRQIPLAISMVLLTTVTLWSLGQAIVRPAEDGEMDGMSQAPPIVRSV